MGNICTNPHSQGWKIPNPNRYFEFQQIIDNPKINLKNYITMDMINHNFEKAQQILNDKSEISKSVIPKLDR